ncbi:MAG: alpha/beta hydrolase [Ardenticatenaceae bacterium]|nr:alpha/beta hydrolase [Ardenticatenaceae bacterium]
MSITTVGSQLVHYEVLGRGKPLIFIHGWLGSWRYWWPAMQAISPHCRTYAFDLWGYGDSSKSEDQYSLSAYVSMLQEFISRLSISKPVILVGHSLGAAIALKYTTEFPEDVAKLVTVALPVQGGTINNRLTNSDPDSVLSKVLGKANSFTEVETEIRKTDQAAMNRLASELSATNFATRLVECPRPVLMVFGDQDPIVPPPSGDYYHLQKPGNNRYYVALSDCNHFPMLQEKAKFNRLLIDFILAQDHELDGLSEKEFWTRRTR